MRYDVAETGLFNIEGLTPYDSVNATNVHKIFRYVNTRRIEKEESQPKKKNKIN